MAQRAVTQSKHAYGKTGLGPNLDSHYTGKRTDNSAFYPVVQNGLYQPELKQPCWWSIRINPFRQIEDLQHMADLYNYCRIGEVKVSIVHEPLVAGAARARYQGGQAGATATDIELQLMQAAHGRKLNAGGVEFVKVPFMSNWDSTGIKVVNFAETAAADRSGGVAVTSSLIYDLAPDAAGWDATGSESVINASGMNFRFFDSTSTEQICMLDWVNRHPMRNRKFLRIHDGHKKNHPIHFTFPSPMTKIQGVSQIQNIYTSIPPATKDELLAREYKMENYWFRFANDDGVLVSGTPFSQDSPIIVGGGWVHPRGQRPNLVMKVWYDVEFKGYKCPAHTNSRMHKYVESRADLEAEGNSVKQNVTV